MGFVCGNFGAFFKEFYDFELGHNATEATKNIYCAKGEDIEDHNTETRWFEKFRSGYKNLDDQES